MRSNQQNIFMPVLFSSRLIISFNEEKCFGKFFMTFLILFLAEQREVKSFLCVFGILLFRDRCAI
jgi:hypothetical protein